MYTVTVRGKELTVACQYSRSQCAISFVREADEYSLTYMNGRLYVVGSILLYNVVDLPESYPEKYKNYDFVAINNYRGSHTNDFIERLVEGDVTPITLEQSIELRRVTVEAPFYFDEHDSVSKKLLEDIIVSSTRTDSAHSVTTDRSIYLIQVDVICCICYFVVLPIN